MFAQARVTCSHNLHSGPIPWSAPMTTRAPGQPTMMRWTDVRDPGNRVDYSWECSDDEESSWCTGNDILSVR
jgi:hypothetical protein